MRFDCYTHKAKEWWSFDMIFSNISNNHMYIEKYGNRQILTIDSTLTNDSSKKINHIKRGPWSIFFYLKHRKNLRFETFGLLTEEALASRFMHIESKITNGHLFYGKFEFMPEGF